MNRLNETGRTVEIVAVPDFGMITFKGNLSDQKVRLGIKKLTGCEVPSITKISSKNGIAVAWMSYDELAIILKRDLVERMIDRLSQRMKNIHHLCVEVSDSRSCFQLKGKSWREVLAKGTPADVSPACFKQGDFRRSRLGNIAVAFWTTEDEVVNLICFRSVGMFMRDWLSNASSNNSLPRIFT